MNDEAGIKLKPWKVNMQETESKIKENDIIRRVWEIKMNSNKIKNTVFCPSCCDSVGWNVVSHSTCCTHMPALQAHSPSGVLMEGNQSDSDVSLSHGCFCLKKKINEMYPWMMIFKKECYLSICQFHYLQNKWNKCRKPNSVSLIIS